MRRLRRLKCMGGCGLELCCRDGMTHSRIDLFQHIRVHFLQYGNAIVYALHGHMLVRIAGPHKYRCPAEISFIVLAVDAIADQSAGECGDAAITAAVPGDVFQHQAGALRESGEPDLFRWYALCLDVSSHLVKDAEGGCKPGLV